MVIVPKICSHFRDERGSPNSKSSPYNRLFESEELASKEFPNLKSPQHGRPTKRDKARNVVVEEPEKHTMSLEGTIKIKHEEGNNGAANITGDGTSLHIINDMNGRSYRSKV